MRDHFSEGWNRGDKFFNSIPTFFLLIAFVAQWQGVSKLAIWLGACGVMFGIVVVCEDTQLPSETPWRETWWGIIIMVLTLLTIVPFIGAMRVPVF